MLTQVRHHVHTVNHKSGFQEVSAETDAVDKCCGTVAMTLCGQRAYVIYALLFHRPSVLISDGASPTAVAVVAAPILKLCDA